MAERAPLVVVIAGPNGAGKSTTAPRLLQNALTVTEFVNADPIAMGLSAFRPQSVAMAAGRVMLARMRALARARRDFAFETTLASRSFVPWLASLRASGYRVHLAFLSLSGPDLAVARVAERVRQGGHDIPEPVVRRRFASGLKNFFSLYQALADTWQMFDNSAADGPRRDGSGRSAANRSRRRNVGRPSGGATMTTSRDSEPTPLDRVEDLPRILQAMTEAVREALLRHKRLGNPVAVWREGRVVWLQPEEIPGD